MSEQAILADLNFFNHNSSLTQPELVKEGDTVYSKTYDHGLTEGKAYVIEDVLSISIIVVKDDSGRQQSYSVEWFSKHKPA